MKNQLALSRPASPWAALFSPKPTIHALDDAKPGTKLARLLASLAELGLASTGELAACQSLTTKQVWGLLKGPLSCGQVRHDDGCWSLNPCFAGRDIERAAALLREAGWYVAPRQVGLEG